jgi:hypothetical protein
MGGFRVSGVLEVQTLSLEESALNTLLSLNFQSEFHAELKLPESYEFTTQQWLAISLSLH